MIFLTNLRFPPPLFVSKSTPPMVSSPCAKSPGTVSGPRKANEKMHARYLVGSFCSSLCRENLVTCCSFCSWRSAHIGTAQKKQQWSICVTCEYHITLACFDPQSFSWHLNPYPPKKTIENPLPNLENVDIFLFGGGKGCANMTKIWYNICDLVSMFWKQQQQQQHVFDHTAPKWIQHHEYHQQ